MHLVIWQGRLGVAGLFFLGVADGNHRLDHQLAGDGQTLPDKFHGTHPVVVIPPAQLNPAAAEPEIGRRQMDDQGGDGTIFNPHVTPGGITANNDGQRRIFKKGGPCALALARSPMASRSVTITDSQGLRPRDEGERRPR